jgi:hypothetical protein
MGDLGKEFKEQMWQNYLPRSPIDTRKQLICMLLISRNFIEFFA